MKTNNSKMKLERLRAARDSYHRLATLPITLKEMCSRFEKVFTGAVSHALREVVLPDQALPHDILPLERDMVLAGPAFTIKSIKASHIEGEMEFRGKMLQEISNYDICVWFTGGDSISAHWGEVMTVTAKSRGARGAVIDGGIRDTKQIIQQGFPIFYKYRTPNGILGHGQLVEYQKPVVIGNVIINPGDFVVGDIDGVVIVPRGIAYQILMRAEEIVSTEKGIKKWIRDGLNPVQIVDKGGYF